MAIRVVCLGAGGHAKVVIETLRLMGGVDVIGLLDPRSELHGTRLLDVPVLGGDDILPKLWQEGVTHFVVGVGGTTDLEPRQRLYEKALALGLAPIVSVHPRAIVSVSAIVGPGTTVMAGAVINAGARLGVNVIVNTGALVEHDCVIADHAHIGPGARLAGDVCIGQRAFVGLGACVKQGVRIADNAVVGAGAVVLRDVLEDQIVVGVPARPLNRKEQTS